MKKAAQKNSAFTLVEIMIVVAIIGLLAAIAIPNFVKARDASQANACVNNLRQIDSAKQQWALEQNQTASGSPVATDIQPYLGRGANGVLPYCPIDTTRTFANSYTINLVNVGPVCKLNAGTITNHVLAAF